MKSNINVTGSVKVELIRDGEVVYTHEDHNLVTDAGKAALATLLTSASAGTSLVTNMGFGTSATAPAASDTTLVAEISGVGYNRANYTVTRTNPSSKIIQYVATLTGITSSTTVNEAGLFSAATGGTLVARYLTGAVTLASASDSLQVTWQITFS